jgi:anaerobic dimethyl sulfoxide reductase subunit C (anchor subunit)
MKRKPEMAAREWPLVVFTLLAQIGVGFFLAFPLPLLLSGDRPEARSMLLISLAGVLAVLAAAGALSFFHLGNPLNAYRTLGNLRESWLSREIFFLLLTTGLLVGLFVLEWTRAGSRTALVALSVAAALAGVALILSMANVYRLEAIPAWDSPMTTFSFLMTAFVLGALGSAAVSAFKLLSEGGGATPFAGRLPMNAAALALLALDLTAVLLFDPNFGLVRNGQRRVDPRPSRALMRLHGLRMALLLSAAAALVPMILAGSHLASSSLIQSLMIGAFVAVLASETLGRVLFFALFRKEGL